MELPSFLWPALAIVLFAITYLGLNKNQRNIVLHRLKLSRNRASNRPNTPSIEDQKASSTTTKNNNNNNNTLSSTFPPSQRDTFFSKLLPTLSPPQQQAIKACSEKVNADYRNIIEKSPSSSLLGLEEDYRTAPDSKLSYSGFSVGEIKAILNSGSNGSGGGSFVFPDYATLCDFPPPEPVTPEFKIEKARPRPYRPFRWAYHQTMSLTKLDPNFWLELESTYVSRIAQRKGLYETHGPEVLQYLPGSELACRELMEMVLQWLCVRYPQYFSLVRHSSSSSSSSSSPCSSPEEGGGKEEEGKEEIFFENKILGTKTCISSSSYPSQTKHPLIILLENVPEDFAIVLRDPETGTYKFRAGVVCSSLGWNVGSIIGKKLHEIHSPIPDYEEKMRFSMDRYFSRLPTSKPIQRGSWGLEVDEPLYLPPHNPSSSSSSSSQSPSSSSPSHHQSLYRESQNPTITRDRLNLRVDWQTLRRLSLSGAVVFNFKALFSPLEKKSSSFAEEPYIPSLLLKILREGKEEIMKYKNTWHVEHVAIPMLEEFEKEQVRRGMIEENWEPRTLDESPWFPGWEERWRGEQGF